MYLTDLATIARRAAYPVIEERGWRQRGHGPMTTVAGIVCHHTAGWGDLHVVRDGRPGLDGPLSQIWLSRRAEIHIVAAGKCWQNAPSTSRYHENHNSIGIEAENDGRTPWPPAQLDAWRRLCAALCLAYQLPAARVAGHREVNRAKVDPHSINMATFRSSIAQLMKTSDGERTEPIETVDGIPVLTRPLRLATPMMHGPDVRAWQSRARTYVPKLVADGWYGKASTAACRKIQLLFGIPVTGVVDPETALLTFIVDPADLEK